MFSRRMRKQDEMVQNQLVALAGQIQELAGKVEDLLDAQDEVTLYTDFQELEQRVSEIDRAIDDVDFDDFLVRDDLQYEVGELDLVESSELADLQASITELQQGLGGVAAGDQEVINKWTRLVINKRTRL